MDRARAAGAVLLLAVLSGCSLLQSTGDLLFRSADTLRERELQRVAKDWCLTIRASQVLPVYPLTEDLEVGDLFLVTRTADQQQREWRERGYMSFDRHVGRLRGLDYADFYGGSYGIGSHLDTPHHWQFPQPPRVQQPLTDWALAPGAFFPTYSFSVSKGSGAQVAIPVQAVPIGLGLLSTQSATGTVVLSDARTYGLPYEDLVFLVQRWVADPGNRNLLDAIRPPRAANGGQPSAWLRVVSRVYLIGSLDVSLISTDVAALGLDAGAAPPQVRLLEAAATPQAYAEALKAINDSLAGREPAGPVDPGAPAPGPGLPAAPSAAVRLTQATTRSITAKETFDRPLVVGYLGIDFPINARGGLDAPRTTLSLVSQAPSSVEGAALGEFTDEQRSLAVEKQIIARRAAVRPDQAVAILDRAAELVGVEFAAVYRERRGEGAVGWEAARDAFTAATGRLPLLPAAGLRPLDAQRLVASALREAQHDVVSAQGEP